MGGARRFDVVHPCVPVAQNANRLGSGSAATTTNHRLLSDKSGYPEDVSQHPYF